MSNAFSGMAAATRRLEASARNIANVQPDGMPRADLAEEAVQQLTARTTFAANAQVVRVAAQMVKSLLNITV